MRNGAAGGRWVSVVRIEHVSKRYVLGGQEVHALKDLPERMFTKQYLQKLD